MQEKFNVCFLCNGHEYAINLGITMVSLLVSSEKDENFSFHIVTNDMSEEDRKKLIQLKDIKDFDIKFYDIDEEIVNKYKNLVEGKAPPWYGYHIFLKLEIPSILKDLDKVLFLDIDLVILKSLKEIFNENIDDYCLLTSYMDNPLYPIVGDNLDAYIKRRKITSVINRKNTVSKWINAGFMYLNLKKLREIYNEEKIVNYILYMVKNGIKTTEEQVINHFMKDDYVKRLPSNYHRTDSIWIDDKYIDDMYIAHCTCGKIFNIDNWIPKHKNKVLLLGWKYLTMTPWFKEDPIYFLEHYSIYNTYYISEELTNIKNINKPSVEKLNELNKLNDTKEKLTILINKIAWFIPIKSIRDNVRKKMRNYFNI